MVELVDRESDIPAARPAPGASSAGFVKLDGDVHIGTAEMVVADATRAHQYLRRGALRR